MKKGQISMEVMYSVGVMILIFLILTGISFNRRSELKKLTDFFEKRNECLKLSNFLTSINTFGDFSYPQTVDSLNVINGAVQFDLKNYADVFDYGVIVIRDSLTTTRTVEATCTYNANLSHLNAATATLPIPPGSYYIQNYDGQVKIKSAAGVPATYKYMTLQPY